jgi:hypothetical protein
VLKDVRLGLHPIRYDKRSTTVYVFDKVEGLFIAASVLVFYDVRFDASYFCFRVLLCA